MQIAATVDERWPMTRCLSGTTCFLEDATEHQCMICFAFGYIVEGLLKCDGCLELEMDENEMQKINGTKMSDALNDLPRHANGEGKKEEEDSEDKQTAGQCIVTNDEKQVWQIVYWLMK